MVVMAWCDDLSPSRLGRGSRSLKGCRHFLACGDEAPLSHGTRPSGAELAMSLSHGPVSVASRALEQLATVASYILATPILVAISIN